MITYRRIEAHNNKTWPAILTFLSLVLLPGSRGTSLTWIPNIAALSAHYRCYALDAIYDFGLSVRSRKLRKPVDLVDWLDEALQAFQSAVPRPASPGGPVPLPGYYTPWRSRA